jgi:hypothetical protein
MNHRELYLQLLSLSHRARLLQTIREQGYFEELEITGASVVEAEPLPYIRFELAPSPEFVARAGGLLMDLRGVLGGCPDCYYLPYIGLTPKAQPGDLAHELKHLSDLMDLLRVAPEFTQDARRFGLFNVSDPTLLEPSVHFEVRKLFLLEVPAFVHEFDEGTRDIEIPILLGLTHAYRCDSRDEFVKLWLASYLQDLRRAYIERFGEYVPQIEKSLKAATDEYGRELWGEQAWSCAMKAWHDLPERIIAQAIAGHRRE